MFKNKTKRILTVIMASTIIAGQSVPAFAAGTDIKMESNIPTDVNKENVVNVQNENIEIQNVENPQGGQENQEIDQNIDQENNQEQVPEIPENDENIESEDVLPNENEDSNIENGEDQDDQENENPDKDDESKDSDDIETPENDENADGSTDDSNDDQNKEPEIGKDEDQKDESTENPDEDLNIDDKVEDEKDSNNFTPIIPNIDSSNNIQNESNNESAYPIVVDLNGFDHKKNNKSYVQYHYSQYLETERFIAAIGEQARHIAKENDLYASVMIAQAILESASGNSELSKAPYCNLFGIKGDYNGDYVSFYTYEDDGTGNMYQVLAPFRSYPTMSESLEDYADLLTNFMVHYYYGATKKYAKTSQEATQFLQGRYATDTSYAVKLNGLIETYDLERFDEELDYEFIDVASGLNVDPEFEWNEDSYANLAAISTAKLGSPYVWGGERDTEGGYDCSGLVYYTYKNALGVTLPRTSQTQQYLGEEVSFDELVLGDLLFFQDSVTNDTYHVAMYLGDGYYIESTSRDGIDGIQITAMEESTPTFAKRILNFQNKTELEK